MWIEVGFKKERTAMTDGALALDRMRRELALGPAGIILGATLDYCENGVARISLPYRVEWEDRFGGVSTGVVDLLAEVSGRLAVASVFASATSRLVDIKMNHLGAEKKDFLAIGEVVLHEPRLAICRLEVLQTQDKTVALGLATYLVSDS